MPELPEVETVVRLIRPRLEGRTITMSEVSWERTLGGLDVDEFAAAVSGARAVRVWRRGKYVLVDLERGGEPAGHLVGHLRMTGRMHVEPAEFEPGPYARVRLGLDDRRVFHFIDVRKFGRLTWVADLAGVFAKLGPEPLGEEFTASWLHDALRARRRLLKPLLLDQSFLAGLGNIYVDEALFAARLHPLTPSNEISRAKATALRDVVVRTLEAAIEREGSSFDTFYRTPEGQPGSYQHQFQVYGRDGKPCRRCGRTLAKIVVGQRGTHLCRRCQPRPRRRAKRANRGDTSAILRRS